MSRGCCEEEGGSEVRIAATVFTLLPNDFFQLHQGIEGNWLQYLQLPHGSSESGALTRRRGLLRNRESSLT